MPIDKNTDNIQVMVRVRPLNSRERAEEAKTCVIIDEDNPNAIILDSKPDQKIFNFDWIGGEATSQGQIFEFIGKPIIATCLEGYNCCIFAYGQTGAGKTFTMQGRGLEADSVDSEFRGLQPRVFDHIFMVTAKEMKENPNQQYLITCSYLEIYNEAIMDLLDPIGTNLQVREDLKKGVYVEGLKEETVTNSEDTIELLRRGTRNRHVGATNMNFESSRSHSVFSMTIESKKTSGGMINVRTSKFHFVDLAGSERQKQTAAAGDRLKEAGNINKSLSVLGAVINSLVEISEGKQRHIRYRDSKLTFILKDSLGGNSKTCIIANVSPASSAFAETLSTLKFVQRAKQIKNKASINEDSTGNLEGLKKEIKKLRDELAQAKSLISTLECDEKKKYITPGKPTTPIQCGILNDEINKKQIMEQNQKALEMEILLKQSLDVLTENELLLQTELAKKEEYINIFKFAADIYNKNEIQYRCMVNLKESKLNRYRNIIEMNKISDINNYIIDENEILKKENIAYSDLLKNMPLLMKTFVENVEMRERIDSMESEYNPNSSVSVSRQLQENLIFLQQLTIKIDDNIRERKFINERLNKIGVYFHGTSSPEMQKKNEEEISIIRMEYNSKIERLNDEILALKQKELELERALDQDRKKISETFREFENLKDSKDRDQEQYEKRINELISNFGELQSSKDMSELEQNLNTLNIKNIELKEQNESYKQKNEYLTQKYNELTLSNKSLLNEKEEMGKEYNKLFDKYSQEKGLLENNLTSQEENIKILLDDLKKYKDECYNLSTKLNEQYVEQSQYKLNFETLFSDKIKLQTELEKIITDKNEELFAALNDLDKEKIRSENAEFEKKKLQEEYDTMIQTFNYNTNELDIKKNLIIELNNKIKDQAKMIDDLDQTIDSNKSIINTLQLQIHEQSQEDSPFNLALKEVQNLRIQLQELKTRLIEIEKINDDLILEKHNDSNRLTELLQSEEHYKKAYKEIFDSFQQKSHELKNSKQALDSKILELEEMEKDIRRANDTLLTKDEEIINLNMNYNILRTNNERLEKENQNNVEKILQLQNILNLKMNDIQSLNTSLIHIQKKYSELEKRLNEAKLIHVKELEELTQNLIILKDTCDKRGNDIENLNKKLNNYEQSNKYLEQHIKDILCKSKNNEDELKANIIELKGIVNGLQNSNDDKSLEINNLLKTLQEKHGNLVEKENIIVTLNEDKKQLENLISEFKIQIQGLKADIINMNRLIEEKTNDIANKLSKIGELEKIINNQNVDINSKNQLINSQIQELNLKSNMINEKEEIITSNMNEFNDLKKVIEEQQHNKDLLQSHINELNQKLKELNDTIDSLYSKINEKDAILEKKAMEIKSYTLKLEENENTLGLKNFELSNLYETFNKTKNNLTQKENQMIALSNDLDAMRHLINDKEQYIEVLTSKIETLQGKNDKIIDDLKNKINEYEKSFNANHEELSKIQKSILENEKLINEKNIEYEALHKKLRFNEEKVLHLEDYIKDFKKKHIREITDINSSQQFTERKKLTEEKSLTLDNNLNRMQQLESRIIQLSFRNERLTYDYNNIMEENKVLKAKNTSLEADIKEKTKQVQEYIDNLLQMKNQLDGYCDLINQLNELAKYKEENVYLKNQNNKQNELINQLNLQAANNFKAQEDEIDNIKQSFIKLENQHQFIITAASIKEAEIVKYKEEIKLMIVEKDKLLEEIKHLKANEALIKKINTENEEKLMKINNEKATLLAELDNLNKINTILAGHSNMDQKIKHLNKLKEENSKIKEEKTKLLEKMGKIQEKNDKLQKKVEELAKKLNIDPKKINQETDESLKSELDAIRLENKSLYDAFSKLNQLLNINFYHRENSSSNHLKKDLESIITGVQDLINVLVDKEKEVRNKELDIESKQLHYNIIERELAVIKQKYQITNSIYFQNFIKETADIHNTNQAKDSKENIPESQTSIPEYKQQGQLLTSDPNPMNIDNPITKDVKYHKIALENLEDNFKVIKKSLGKQSSGIIDFSLIENKKNSKTKESLEKFGRKMLHMHKISIEKAEAQLSPNKIEGKLSFGKDSAMITLNNPDTPEFSAKKALATLEDLTNHSHLEEQFSKRKKLKINNSRIIE